MSTSRRRFLRTAAQAAPAVVVGACGGATAASTRPARAEESPAASTEEGGHAEISPNEDLMREHGIIQRVLLVYEESADRLERGDPSPIPRIVDAVSVVERFVEGYHERQEEELVFPVAREAGLGDLVDVLVNQHEAGKQVTARIRALATASSPDPGALVAPLRAFVTMYRPHSAREDTVLFPAFREALSASEMDRLSGRFEEMEHQILGEGAFERIRGEVAAIEASLGIAALAQFTPDVEGSLAGT